MRAGIVGAGRHAARCRRRRQFELEHSPIVTCRREVSASDAFGRSGNAFLSSLSCFSCWHFSAIFLHFSLGIFFFVLAFFSRQGMQFSSVLCSAHLFGKSKFADLSYKILFLIFVVIGAAGDMSAVWTFSDAMILALVFPNMIGLMILYPTVKEELTRYISAIKSKVDS